MKSRTKKVIAFGLGGTLLAAATGFQLTRVFFESPDYDVVKELGDIEIRRYAPRLVAETWVDTRDQRKATDEGFRRLADYIFGGNRSIAMTTPVESGAGPSSEKTPSSEKISMTTPVEAKPSDERGYRVAFTMPQKYTLENIPKPTSDKVELREVDEKTVAALRFSGSANEADKKRHQKQLLQQLSESRYQPVGEPWLARYDPPMWVLPFFRRNEVLVEVKAGS